MELEGDAPGTTEEASTEDKLRTGTQTIPLLASPIDRGMEMEDFQVNSGAVVSTTKNREDLGLVIHRSRAVMAGTAADASLDKEGRLPMVCSQAVSGVYASNLVNRWINRM